MAKQRRYKTNYPGVFYILGVGTGRRKQEKIYYIRYRKNGRVIEEKAGRQFQNDMTPSRAAGIRAKRIEGNLTNKEKREALEAKRRAEAGKWTVSRLWAEYKRQHPDLKGRQTDESRFENHLAKPFGGKEPAELIPLDVDRLRIRLLKTLKPGTVRNILELLRRIVNFGVKKRLCDGISFVIELPTANNLKTEDLSPAQLQRLLEAIEQEPNIQAAGLMKMALFTGLRRGEMLRLKWEHIDSQSGFIRLVNPKGGIDQKIPLNSAAKQFLENHPRISEFVFPGRGGRQRTDCNKQVNAIKKRARLPKDFRPLHGLRHVFASMLASSGEVDIYTLQKLLTHKSPQMTQRYAHLRDDALKRASELAGRIITGQKGKRKIKAVK